MMRASFDPMQLAFGVGQELYKAGLLSTVNARRQSLGKAPIGWPAVATTPREEVWSEGPAHLFRYRIKNSGAGGKNDASAQKNPLLIVCSLINRPYVLDLLEERSVIRRLAEAGRDVWLLDWGTPLPGDAEHGLAHYALGVLPRAGAAVLAATRAEQLHVLGYCMGGTFTLAAIAAGRLPAAGLVALATPVDLHDDGTLSTWCRTPGFDAAGLARAYGNVPPFLLQPAFKLLDPVGMVTKLVHLDGKIADDAFLRFFLAMETWLEDSVAFPGRAFAEWVSAYRDNALARGRLTLDGTRIDLGRVRCPILNVVAAGDYITPPRSSLALGELAGAVDQEVVQMEGGHIGLSTGRAAHEKLWPRVAAWLDAHDTNSLRDRTTKSASVGTSLRERTKKSAGAGTSLRERIKKSPSVDHSLGDRTKKSATAETSLRTRIKKTDRAADRAPRERSRRRSAR